MKVITNVIQKIVAFFSSAKAEAALNQAAALVPKALPIVQELAAIAPNKTDQEILAAYQKYAVPLASHLLTANLAQRGYLLLQLATQVLAKNVPNVATNILDTAVQLAVTGTKAQVIPTSKQVIHTSK
jgi:flavoprotein